MTPEETISILARWVSELRYQRDCVETQVAALEGRVQRLEHDARRRATARRHWMRAKHQAATT